MKKVKKLLIVVNVDWFFISHRLPIAIEAIQKGWEVTVVAKDTGQAKLLKDYGIQFVNLPIERSGTNPLKELVLIYKLYAILRYQKPTVVHHVTLKPVIYGSLISKILSGYGVVNAISGLGYNFTESKRTIINVLMLKLMKFAFNRPNNAFIFQNTEDYNELKSHNVINQRQTIYFIKGSGVDLSQFKYVPEPTANKIIILFAARLSKSKGILELREAFDILVKKFENQLELRVCGAIDKESKDAVSISFMESWVYNTRQVIWEGFIEDMPNMYQQASIVVFPSYREGMPKTLIDACASGRPIVTTLANGCKECVDEGINGFKVPVKSVEELVKALEVLILNKPLRSVMGKNSRIKAIKEFDVKDVVDSHISIYEKFFKSENKA